MQKRWNSEQRENKAKLLIKLLSQLNTHTDWAMWKKFVHTFIEKFVKFWSGLEQMNRFGNHGIHLKSIFHVMISNCVDFNTKQMKLITSIESIHSSIMVFNGALNVSSFNQWLTLKMMKTIFHISHCPRLEFFSNYSEIFT